jgi:hypothetical protein
MYLIDIMAKSFRVTMYFVCRFSHYVLRNRMSFVCSEYVEQCSFVWTASRLCTCTIGYLTLLPLWAVRPVQSFSACTRAHFTFTFYKDKSLNAVQGIMAVCFNIPAVHIHTVNKMYSFLGASAKSRKATVSFVTSGRTRLQPDGFS